MDEKMIQDKSNKKQNVHDKSRDEWIYLWPKTGKLL